MLNAATARDERPESDGDGARLLSSALKCLRLLEAVARFDHSAGVSELARELGGSRGAIHVQLTTLTHAGWLERVEGGRYRLTLRPLRVGQAALRQGGIGSWVLPVMEDLGGETGESISLSVIDGPDALIVWRVESPQLLRTDLRVGTRMSIHGSASGRVLAAFGRPALVRRAVAEGARLPPRQLLERVRARGWAESIDDFVEGVAAVAAPVVDGHGNAIGALSVAGPTSRFVPSDVVGAVCAAANRLSSTSGDQGYG
jgi:DNA-binding IclR family transcriptional regulator